MVVPRSRALTSPSREWWLISGTCVARGRASLRWLLSSAKSWTTRGFSLDERCLCPGARRDHWPHLALTLMEASIKLSARAERQASRTLRLKGNGNSDGLAPRSDAGSRLAHDNICCDGGRVVPVRRRAPLAARSHFPCCVLHPRAGQRRVALARQSGDLRRPEARDRRRHEKLGRCPDFDFTGWVPRHPDRGRARRRPLSLGARSPLGCYCWLRSFGSGWAQAVNRHFEPSVRIQTDRDHHVVTTGPYAFVRHPGYVSGTVLVAGMALALGSLWALLPAAFVAVVLVIRTNLEDATLQRELPGYAGYAARVRSKWIPGVW